MIDLRQPLGVVMTAAQSGLGKDLRIRSSSVAGAALEVGDLVIHLCAFRLAAHSQHQKPHQKVG